MNIKGKFIVFILTAVCLFSLVSCADKYEEYHTEDNKIGTVTVDEKELTAYYFLLEDGSAVLDVCDSKSKILQTIEFPVQSDYYTSLDFDFGFANAIFQDMNFDGHKDLYVPCSVTTPNLEGMAWLWDSDKGEFVLSEELSALYELTVFPDEKLITSQDYANEDGILCKEYKWENGKLVQTGEYIINN